MSEKENLDNLKFLRSKVNVLSLLTGREYQISKDKYGYEHDYALKRKYGFLNCGWSIQKSDTIPELTKLVLFAISQIEGMDVKK